MGLFRKLAGLPEMPAPVPGQAISPFSMAGYVFTISLDLGLVGPESLRSAIRAVTKSDVNEIEIVTFTMSPFIKVLARPYGWPMAESILRTAADRTAEFYQKQTGLKGAQINWSKAVEEIVQNGQHYSKRISLINKPEDLISICHDAAQHITGQKDPFIGMAVAAHFSRTHTFAQGFVTTIPLVMPET